MRKCGVLLAISSIPSKYGIGAFSKEAYAFVDFLEKAGQKLWQILPLGPTGYGDSPYQSFSTFAGNPYYIDLEALIEEAAMIDGCNPLQTFFGIVLPIMKPTCITVAILQAMWIWNDYLLPYLVLDLKTYKTIPMAIQYLKGGYGQIDMGAMMAMLVLAMIPIIAFYLACQKYIIEGVIAGAVKG